MYNINPQMLYMNSYLHFSKKKPVEIQGEIKDICVNLLDRRFVTTSVLEELQQAFPYCKLKILDDYWIGVYSSYPLNQSKIFYYLLDKGLIISLSDFIKMIER